MCKHSTPGKCGAWTNSLSYYWAQIFWTNHNRYCLLDCIHPLQSMSEASIGWKPSLSDLDQFWYRSLVCCCLGFEEIARNAKLHPASIKISGYSLLSASSISAADTKLNELRQQTQMLNHKQLITQFCCPFSTGAGWYICNLWRNWSSRSSVGPIRVRHMQAGS